MAKQTGESARQKDTRATVYFVAATACGAISLSALLAIIVLVIMDIDAGALKGVSETGWGMAIALFFGLPVFIVTGILGWWLARLYSRRTQRSRTKIVLAAFVGAILLSAYMSQGWLLG